MWRFVLRVDLNSILFVSPIWIMSCALFRGSCCLLLGPRRSLFFSSACVRNVLVSAVEPVLIWLYPAIDTSSAPSVLIERSCIVSMRFVCRPEWIRVSSVNSNISHSVARERAKLKIRIAARSGFVLIRFVLWRT